MEYSWNTNYVRNFNPNTRIRIEPIAEKIEDMLQGSTIHWKLPYWDFNASQKLQISNFSIDRDTIRIIWKLK